MHECRGQEGYLQHSRLIVTILDKISKILEEMVCQRNEYDWRVMKKIVNDKQCIILWNVD